MATKPAPQTPSPEHILQLGFAFFGSKTLLTAIELGLFTALAEGPLEAGAIIGKLGLHQRGARDFLDVLLSLGLLEREGGQYRNTPEASLFLDRGKPSYLGGIFEMANARLYPSWGRLTQALQTGQPQSEAGSAGDTFEALYSTPERLRLFLAGMTGISLGPARALAAKPFWSGYRTFLDVGSAQGCVPVQVALAHPHLHGAGFDLPQVAPVFEEYVSSFGLTGRVGFKPGNFFSDPLPRADVIVMGHILHDWNLEEKLMLIRKAFDALPAGGTLVVYESLIDDDRRRNTFGLLMSLNMLIETQGGFDFTGADCREWMRQAGFRESRVEHLAGPAFMVAGIK